MTASRTLRSVLVLLTVVSTLAACGGSPAAPPPGAPPPATASVPSTPTPTPPAAPPTASPVPPTNTPPRPTQAATVPAQAKVGVTLETFKFSSEALKGNLLGDTAERPVQVILPASYAGSNKRYPVVYYLHGYGAGGNASTPMADLMGMWFANYAPMFAKDQKKASGNFQALVEEAAGAGETQEMILVFPNASNALGGSMFLSSPGSGDVETYLTKELVEYIDSHYRTLPERASRGVAGCSMGADGAVHLALKFPDLYSAAAAQSTTYKWDQDPNLLGPGLKGYTKEPATTLDFLGLPWETQMALALAAAVSPNPDKKPWGFDMPYSVVDGKTEIAPDFLEKVRAHDPRADVNRYGSQPGRPLALLVQHGQNDPIAPLELSREFDEFLTAKGIPHEFDDSFDSHCTFDMVKPMLEFMSEHLAGSEGEN